MEKCIRNSNVDKKKIQTHSITHSINITWVVRYSLIHGAGLRLTGGGSSFKHGNLLRLYSSAPDPTTGVVRVLANAVNTGTIMKLSMDEIGNGTGIRITSGNGTSMNTSGSC